jgi:hypothetical protein
LPIAWASRRRQRANDANGRWTASGYAIASDECPNVTIGIGGARFLVEDDHHPTLQGNEAMLVTAPETDADVGKTTFAAGAPAPVFICTEDGLGTLEATHFPLSRTFDEVMEALAVLYEQDHTFATVVVDSVDWLEPLVWQKACQENGWKDLEQPGFP